MKHIKSYENTIEEIPTMLKRYIVVQDKESATQAYIVEIINISNTMVNYKQLYYLDRDYLTNTHHKSSHMTIKQLFQYHSLIYQSDNLEDCVNLIKSLIITTKYNL